MRDCPWFCKRTAVTTYSSSCQLSNGVARTGNAGKSVLSGVGRRCETWRTPSKGSTERKGA